MIVNSAKSLSEQYERLKKRNVQQNLKTKLATEQITLLKEANTLWGLKPNGTKTYANKKLACHLSHDTANSDT